MTPRRELNEFLVAQRTRLSRDGLGLPPLNSRQRTQGLRREDVAVLAGISPYYYASPISVGTSEPTKTAGTSCPPITAGRTGVGAGNPWASTPGAGRRQPAAARGIL